MKWSLDLQKSQNGISTTIYDPVRLYTNLMCYCEPDFTTKTRQYKIVCKTVSHKLFSSDESDIIQKENQEEKIIHIL